MEVTQQHLDDSLSLESDLEGHKMRAFTIFAKLDIGLLEAIFKLNHKKFTNYTHDDAVKLFNDLGCNAGKEKEFFRIERKDDDGVVHKFSGHVSHGHSKENKMYYPTNLYLRHFCQTIGLTKDVVEAYQG